jgi:hypothetical protein
VLPYLARAMLSLNGPHERIGTCCRHENDRCSSVTKLPPVARLLAILAICRRSTIEGASNGVGPLTALAIEAFAPDMNSFKRGRDFAAWLGLVPRQHSSGGKERLGHVSKAGQVDIRRLLIIGAVKSLAIMTP